MKYVATGLALVFCLSVGSSLSYAQEYGHTGLYVGGGGSYIMEQFDASELGANVTFDDSFGANAKVGYRIHPRFAIEADGLWLKNFDDPSNSKIDGFAVSGNAKVFLATANIQPYAVAGGGWATLDATSGGRTVSDADAFVRLGGGVDMYMTDHLLLYVEGTYVLTTGQIKDNDVIPMTIGLQVRF